MFWTLLYGQVDYLSFYKHVAKITKCMFLCNSKPWIRFLSFRKKVTRSVLQYCFGFKGKWDLVKVEKYHLL